MEERGGDADYLASGFRNVDQQASIDKFKTCLSYMDQLDSFRIYKAEMVRRLGLQPGHRVLDIGCGLGFDVDTMAEIVGMEGQAVGLDLSRSLVSSAIERNAAKLSKAQFVVGDAHQLEFDDESFDACRIDRTLQHLDDPQRVVEEMCRVSRRGGRIVCAEPDWATFTIASQDKPTVRKVVEMWGDRFRHGWVGRDLFRMFRHLKLDDVELSGHLLVAEGLAEADTVFDIARTVAMLTNSENTCQYSEWLTGLARSDAECPVLATVTLFLISGRMPMRAARAATTPRPSTCHGRGE